MSNESRRKLLKSIAAGSGAVVAGKSLPESWSRPVVDSVMLPVHAQTSTDIVYSDTGILGEAVAINELEDENMLAQFVDGLVTEAQAGALPTPENDGFYVCAVRSGSTLSLSVAGLGGRDASPTEAVMIRRGTLPAVAGAEGTITAGIGDMCDCCEFEPGRATRAVRIVSISDTQLVIDIVRRTIMARIRLTIDTRIECLPEPPLASECEE